MNKLLISPVTQWLKKTNRFWFSLYTGGTAFFLYTCIYGFRKAFAVGTFEGQSFLDVDYKVWLVTFQVIGYALSKFIGIKVISEIKAEGRAINIFWMAVIAGLSWLAFAITPPPFNLVFLFTNGLPLGLVWGMIFSYLEGRSTTEVLGAGLSISFVFSSGFAKSVGAFLMQDFGVVERWMPFATSAVFFIPLLIFLWLLDQVPPPTASDMQQRTRRTAMRGAQRKAFVLQFLPGILFFVITYMMLTTFRDFRDNFAIEFWNHLGYGNHPEIFTETEVPISIIVLIMMGSIMFIKRNEVALDINHLIILTGLVLVGFSTLSFQMGWIDPPFWMILSGLGLYMGYVPFNCIFFDRLIATFKITGTVGFIMYLADSFGYLGSVSVMFLKEFGYHDISWLNFYVNASYILSVAGSGMMIGSWLYFRYKYNAQTRQMPAVMEVD